MEHVQLAISALVTLGLTVFGYLSLKVKIQAQGHETRIKSLEAHVEQCNKSLVSVTEELATPWPSDHDDFTAAVLTVKRALEKAGTPFTMKDAARIARRMLALKAKNETKVDLGKESPP